VIAVLLSQRVSEERAGSTEVLSTAAAPYASG
jgi:hypothetical protein